MHRIGHAPLTWPRLEKWGEPTPSPHTVLWFLLRQGRKMERKEGYLQPQVSTYPPLAFLGSQARKCLLPTVSRIHRGDRAEQ